MIALCEMVEFYECASRLNFTGSSKLRARAWFFLGKMLKKVHNVSVYVDCIRGMQSACLMPHYYSILFLSMLK